MEFHAASWSRASMYKSIITPLRTTAACRRPSISSMTRSIPLISRAFQHLYGFRKRQAHDGLVRTADKRNKFCGNALDGLAASLALPFVAIDIVRDVGV